MGEPLADAKLRLVETLDDALAFKRWLGERRPVLAVDTETGGLEFWNQPLRLVQFGDAMSGWSIPFGDWAGLVKEALAGYEGEMVGHNVCFDLRFLERNGVRVRRDLLHDTRTMAHILDPNRPLGLKDLADKLIDARLSHGQQLLHDGMKKHGWTWATVPVDFTPYWLYASLDTVLTARLYERFRPQVDTAYAGVYDLEMAVALILSDMEVRGFRVDLDYTRETAARLDTFTDEMREFCKTAYGINPTSTRQVADLLVSQGIQLVDRTPSGQWKLDEATLAGIADQHPLAQHVLDLRRAGKFHKSYFDRILRVADGDVVHAEIKPLAARTARMSISNPPLQQLPSDSPLVRDCFIPREGHRLVTCDFDQIEARLLAHFAQEPAMLEAIRTGVDLHTFMAGQMYRTDSPTKAQRKMSKSGTFGKLYGIGKAKFAAQQGVSVEEAEAFLSMFDRTFTHVAKFTKDVENVGRQRLNTEGVGYIMSPLGRRHPLGKHDDGFYKLVNYLCQGTAADVLKQKLVALDAAGLGEWLVLPVHDEVIVDCPSEYADEVAVRTAEVMADLTSFSVPLTAEAKVVDRWGDAYREAA